MWTRAHIYDLDDVHILKARRGGHCQIKFGHGSDTQVREVNFSSEKEGMRSIALLRTALHTRPVLIYLAL